ncbi:MAG: hypothetical protein Kow0029_25580 [Candidatus Rifleibacteriota bacterium]
MNQNPDCINWVEAPEDSIVCYCQNVSKKKICQAIENGAKTVADITRLTGAGKGNQCLQLNPRKRCCHPDIDKILKLYSDGSDQENSIQPCCCK